MLNNVFAFYFNFYKVFVILLTILRRINTERTDEDDRNFDSRN